MKANKERRLKSFKMSNQFNIDYSPYFIIEDGIFRFLDLNTKIKFMYHYGITCQCQKKLVNNKVIYCYNDIPITEQQKDFLHKRALGLLANNQGVNIHYECGCKNKKKKRPQ